MVGWRAPLGKTGRRVRACQGENDTLGSTFAAICGMWGVGGGLTSLWRCYLIFSDNISIFIDE